MAEQSWGCAEPLRYRLSTIKPQDQELPRQSPGECSSETATKEGTEQELSVDSPSAGVVRIRFINATGAGFFH